MLQELSIQNFALIDQIQVHFAPGFNVLTGETGAGKSILAGALGLLLGGKNENGVIRSGCEESTLSGVITLDRVDQDRDQWLADNGFSSEDGSLVLRRIIRSNKRGALYIQGQSATRSQLEELTAFLVDMHGQHEHQSLFIPDNHRKNLDRFSGLWPDLEDFQQEFQKWVNLRKDYEALAAQESGRLEEIDRLNHIIQEIEKASLRPGEEEELKAEKNRLDQHEKLYGALENLHTLLLDSRTSALGQLHSARQSASLAASIDQHELGALGNRMESAYLELEDLAQSYRNYQLHLEFSPDRLEAVNERLTLIYGLQKKHSPTIEGILELLDKAKEKVQSLENFTISKQAALQNLQTQDRVVAEKAAALSLKREKGAQSLASQIKNALAELGMARGDFKISVTRKVNEAGKSLLSATGYDQVEFLFSGNLGEPVKPLKDIASGGELSRVMLALKSILSEADNIPILVFDEIDTGIGGEMGVALGRFMKKIAQTKQVLCITHLASIASFAHHHLRIEKSFQGDRTVTTVSPVDGESRVKEIARMLSGDTGSEMSLGHAKQLLESNARS